MMRVLSACTVAAILLARANPGVAQDVDAGFADDAGTVEIETAVEPQAEPEPAQIPALAESPASPAQPDDGYHRFTLGAYIGLGMAHSIYSWDSAETSPRFAGAGGMYVDFRLARVFAFDVGVDLVGKGCLFNDGMERLRLIYLEIPVGVKLFVGRFAVGVALGIDVALYAKRSSPSGESGQVAEVNRWDDYRRFNLSPRVTLGYAIPIGRVSLVPGLAWSIEALDTAKGGLAGGDSHDWTLHNMNLMFTLGVELGVGAPKAATPNASAGSSAKGEPFHRFAVGAYGSLGMARYVEENHFTTCELCGDDLNPRFVGGGGAYFDVYLAKQLALDIGIGFVGKGHTGDVDDGELRLTYLELPLGATLDFWGVRIGLALALEIGLKGTFSGTSNMGGHYVSEWGDEQWDSFRRVNFGPRLTLGYAIRVKRVAIVPSVAWSMDILDNLYGGEDAAAEVRNMNLMFNLGLELGFGGGK